MLKNYFLEVGDIVIDTYKILNFLSELVYISDLETHELLYVNESGKIANNIYDDYLNKQCYKVLQGRDTPCEFCMHKTHLSRDSFYTWEYYSPKLNRYFISKDTIINFEGRDARLQIATDITHLKQQNEYMKNLIAADKLLIDCISKLHEDTNIKARINTILEYIGQFTKTRSLYIFEKGKNDTFNATYKWAYGNIVEAIDEKKSPVFHIFDRWREAFDNNKCVFINDIEEIKDKDEYEKLKVFKIESMIVAPLKYYGKTIGFIGIDNPPNNIFNISETFFSTIGYFIAAVISKEKIRKELQIMSYVDKLTGVNNRNKFMHDINLYNENSFKNLCVIYIDLNGLKEINDKQGHAAGDKKIIQLSNIIKSLFNDEYIYRIGGDEFCVICTPIEYDDFEIRVKKLKELLSDINECSASIGYRYTHEFADIDKIIREADRMMYENKRKYYEENKKSTRYRNFK